MYICFVYWPFRLQQWGHDIKSFLENDMNETFPPNILVQIENQKFFIHNFLTTTQFFFLLLCARCARKDEGAVFRFAGNIFWVLFFCDLALTSVIRIDHGWAGDFRCQFRNSCGLRGLDLTSTNTDSVYLSLMDNLVNLTKVRNSLSSNTAVWFFCSGKCTSS